MALVVTTTSGDLGWLGAWKQQLGGVGQVLVAHAPSIKVALPSGFEHAVLISSAPAELASAATAQLLSPRDLAVLACKAPRILFLGEGSSPALAPCTKPSGGHLPGSEVQLVEEHAYNLSTPATPLFFNTLYDPFRTGADFVRGYPFSWRDGLRTGVSHGLTLDAANPNGRYVDATLTVPKEALCVFSASNLAIDRALVGIASYNGVDVNGKPVSAVDDNSWSSLCTKVLCNHLGYGCKTGLPFVKSSQPSAGASEQGLANAKWQTDVVAFFEGVRLSAAATTPEAAYTELAAKVREQLGAVDPHFAKVADAMLAWANAFVA